MSAPSVLGLGGAGLVRSLRVEPLLPDHHGRADAGSAPVAMGLFDDPDALPLASEIYIDRKPSSFAYAGSHHR